MVTLSEEQSGGRWPDLVTGPTPARGRGSGSGGRAQVPEVVSATRGPRSGDLKCEASWGRQASTGDQEPGGREQVEKSRAMRHH